MTIYGIDIASYQDGLDLGEVKREGFDFVFVKVTQGLNYVNPDWESWRATAAANGLILAGYHYLDTSNPDIQAELFVSHLGAVPAMIDFEQGGGAETNFWAFVNACNARGVQIRLSYEPRWYWQQIGSPDITQLPGLIQSSYVTGTGPASALYPGDDWTGWTGFGGASVQVLQYTDAALVAGMTVDANAFRGTRQQLSSLLGDNSTGALMEQTDPIVNTAGQTVTVQQMLAATDFHASMALEQLAGPGTSTQPGPALEATGWQQLGGHSVVDALAAIGQKLGIPGFAVNTGVSKAEN